MAATESHSSFVFQFSCISLSKRRSYHFRHIANALTLPATFKSITLLPKEIEDLNESNNADDRDFSITKATFLEKTPSISLRLKQPISVESKIIAQSWLVEIAGYRMSRIIFDESGQVSIEEDHPILWEYMDTKCSLYFSGKCANIGQLFSDLYSTHYALFNDLISFYHYLNVIGNLTMLLDFGHGLLANGPKRVLTFYADCLEKHGIQFSLANERPPSYWNGEQYVSEDKDLKILFIGHSYIVGSEFIFRPFE